MAAIAVTEPSIEEHKWVYEAEEEGDYDFEENEMTWEAAVEGEEEYEYEEYYEEEEEVKVIKPAIITKKDPNVSDAVFYDDESLTNCWKAALSDYKFLHPAAFGPITEAPRSMVKKLQLAPLWYAPAPSHNAEETQTSSMSNNKKRKQNNAKKSSSSKKQKTTSVDYISNNQSIASTSTSTFTDSTTLLSPTFTPQSPDVEKYESLQEDPLILEEDESRVLEAEDETSKKSKKKVSFAGPHLPSAYAIPTQPQPLPLPPSLPTPSSFQPPPVPSTSAKSLLLNRDYPEPPGLIEPPVGSGLVEISPEEKLQNALWSWYEAGYNTALYHTALGALEKEKSQGGSSSLKR